jgi:NAD(P)-dependent dehydrogenase (short-subunit alcohol dehydrogenase family)
MMALYGVPEEAVKTREKMATLASTGSFAQMLTAMMPLGRPGFPDEIATAALFLASDMAKYISGANLVVDGAQSWR